MQTELNKTKITTNKLSLVSKLFIWKLYYFNKIYTSNAKGKEKKIKEWRKEKKSIKRIRRKEIYFDAPYLRFKVTRTYFLLVWTATKRNRYFRFNETFLSKNPERIHIIIHDNIRFKRKWKKKIYKQLY